MLVSQLNLIKLHICTFFHNRYKTCLNKHTDLLFFVISSKLKSVMGATLTVTSVRKEDIGRIFTCLLYSQQSIQGSTVTNVQIF